MAALPLLIDAGGDEELAAEAAGLEDLAFHAAHVRLMSVSYPFRGSVPCSEA